MLTEKKEQGKFYMLYNHTVFFLKIMNRKKYKK